MDTSALTSVPATVLESPPAPLHNRPIVVPSRRDLGDSVTPLRILVNHAAPEDAEARRAISKTLVHDAGADVDGGYNVIILEPQLHSAVVKKYEEIAEKEPVAQSKRKRECYYELHKNSALRMTVAVQADLYTTPPLIGSSRRGGVCVMDLTYHQVMDLYSQCGRVLDVLQEPTVSRLVEEKGKQ